VTRPLTRDEALQVLGVPPAAGADTVKRAYRRLAREHHPDLGGDPDIFHQLQQAFEQLSVDAPASRPPVVSRGRPSRPQASFRDEDVPADLDSVDWDVSVPGGDAPLDRNRLAVKLATDRSDVAVEPLLATSRAPGSRLNRLAAKLAAELTSRLDIMEARDDRGQPVVAVELTASNRRARRALDRIPLNGVWTRTRRSSSTLLRTTLAPSEDPRTTAVRTTNRVAAMLDSLDWPLTGWTSTTAQP